jgi:FkbM family methyltransferase
VVTIGSGHAQGLKWRRFHRYVNGYWIGQYELEMQNALVRQLKPGARFFDVGANAGFFSLIAAHTVGPTGSCVSFDPDPANQESISAQQQENGFIHWKSECCAISDRAGKLKFSSLKPGDPTARSQPPEASGTGFEANAITLDQACEKYGVPDVIKMDIEGAEYLALQGASGLLSKARPVFLIELHGTEVAFQVRELLKGHGYRFFTIQEAEIPPTTELPYHILAKA